MAAKEKHSATEVLKSVGECGKLCTPDTGTITMPTPEVVEAILKLAQALAEMTLYDYQKDFARRFLESLLLRDGATITALFSRQSGKTSVVASIVAACSVILPELAKQFPDDWRFNMTDNDGRYRGFRNGIRIGIYAPIEPQASIMFDRLRTYIGTPTAETVLSELGIKAETNRGNRLVLSNGSRIMARSASVNSHIEGDTHELLVIEEAQDVDTMVVRKSLSPMVSSVKGTTVKIGTASIRKCDFFHAINTNKKREATTGRKDHFYYPAAVCAKYNSLYRDYVEEEKVKLGENSDEFRMAYKVEWILERGMFITAPQLMQRGIAITEGTYSKIHKSYPGRNLVVGIDLGKENDSTVVTVMDVEWDNPAICETVTRNFMESDFVAYNKHVLGWLELQGDDYEVQFGEIVFFLSRFRGIQKIILDATREASFHDRLSHHPAFEDVEFEDFIFSTATKAAAWRILQGDLLSGRITFPAGAEARQTVEYRKFVTQGLDLVKSYQGEFLNVAHPDEKGAHDDYWQSLALACWSAETPPRCLQIETATGSMYR